MKIIKRGKFIYFDEFTIEEINTIESLLEFNEYNYATGKYFTHNFLFYDKKTTYTWFGYKDYLIEMLRDLGVEVEYIEEEPEPIDIDIEKLKKLGDYTLRDYQLVAVVKALQQRFGTVISATGSGKSLMMGSIIKYLDKPSLVVVPTIQLAQQLYKNFLDYGFDEDELTILTNGKKPKKHNIAVINTIVNIVRNKSNLLKDIKVYIVDEAQYRQASTYREVDTYFNDKVEYALGFTGTIYRYSKTVEQKKSLEDWISYGMTGRNPIVNIDYKFLISKKVLSTPYVYVETINYPQTLYSKWQDVLRNLIIDNDKRNQKIAEWVEFFYNEGAYPVLILTDTIRHIENMASFLPDYILEDSIAILGNKKVLKYDFGEFRNIKIFDYNSIIEDIQNERYKVVFGSPVIQAGFDLPEVRSMILAYSGKSEVKILQRIGRGLRITDDKDKVFIVDFYDNTHAFLKNHSKIRVKLYKENNFPLLFSYKNEEKKFKQLVKNNLTRV